MLGSVRGLTVQTAQPKNISECSVGVQTFQQGTAQLQGLGNAKVLQGSILTSQHRCYSKTSFNERQSDIKDVFAGLVGTIVSVIDEVANENTSNWL